MRFEEIDCLKGDMGGLDESSGLIKGLLICFISSGVSAEISSWILVRMEWMKK